MGRSVMRRSARPVVAGDLRPDSLQKGWLLKLTLLMVMCILFWRRIRSEALRSGAQKIPRNAVLCGNKLSPGDESRHAAGSKILM